MGIATPAKQRSLVALGGTEKVAALLLAMGRQAAASVLQQFEPQEIRIVTKAAAELRPITAQELESIIHFAADTMKSTLQTGAGIIVFAELKTAPPAAVPAHVETAPEPKLVSK